MNVLLLSLGLGALQRYAPPLTMGFVPTAGEPYTDPSFVTADRRRLERLGYRVVDIDVTNMEEADILSGLGAVDALFVAGGNTFYLMQQIRRRRLVDPLKQYIQNGGVYIGASAGAVICGPSLEPVASLDDPAAAPDLATFDGLGVVNFVTLPHFGKPKYIPRYEEIEVRFGAQFELVKLRDDQAIFVVTPNSREIVEFEMILSEI